MTCSDEHPRDPRLFDEPNDGLPLHLCEPYELGAKPTFGVMMAEATAGMKLVADTIAKSFTPNTGKVREAMKGLSAHSVTGDEHKPWSDPTSDPMADMRAWAERSDKDFHAEREQTPTPVKYVKAPSPPNRVQRRGNKTDDSRDHRTGAAFRSQATTGAYGHLQYKRRP